jgi:hypothetical protein
MPFVIFKHFGSQLLDRFLRSQPLLFLKFQVLIKAHVIIMNPCAHRHTTLPAHSSTASLPVLMLKQLDKDELYLPDTLEVAFSALVLLYFAFVCFYL